MDMLQIPGQMELLCDVINKNESSFPIQDFFSDQVPLTVPYIESSSALTYKALVFTVLNIVIYNYSPNTVCKMLVSLTVRAAVYFMTNGQSTLINFSIYS